MEDMIPPNQGSRLSQDSSPNRTPGKNCYISGEEGPNEISQDVTERERTLIYVVNVLDLEDTPVTCGSLYNFTILNYHETSHLGKMLISPNC